MRSYNEKHAEHNVDRTLLLLLYRHIYAYDTTYKRTALCSVPRFGII
jgi:hypothetical protein